MQPEVVVTGAGPGGIAAAVHLARSGRDVVVIDKATFPRDKVCGDGLTAAALRELESLGLAPASVESWNPVGEIVLRSPSGRTVTLPLPAEGHFAAVASRHDLDARLVELARDEGVTVLEDTPLLGATADPDGITVHTPGRDLRARWVVGADGMWSPLRKALGAPPHRYRGEWHAFRQYHEDVTGPAATRLVVAFEPELLPGYFWAFPLPGGRANAGFGIVRGGHVAVGQMRRVWEELLARPHLRAILGPQARPTEPARAWPIPARPDRMPATVGRALFVGDALAACDLLTGEGIGQALLTGRLAARAVAESGDDPSAARERYEEALTRQLLPDHRMSSWLNRLVAHRKGARAGIWLASRTDWTRRNFARWLFEDYPRGILLTPRRWRRGLMSGPGAWPNGTPAATGRPG